MSKLKTGLTKRKYEFRENNSGGSWWLSKGQYEKLFKAGCLSWDTGCLSGDTIDRVPVRPW